MSAHVVHTVGEEERLLVGHAFAQLFNTAVYVTRHHINLLDDFAVERGAQAHNAVSTWVLRTEVHNIFVFTKHLFVYAGHVAIGIFNHGKGVVLVFLRIEAYRVQFGICIIILAQRVSHPVVAQEEAAHIGVIDELNAKEVIHFTFLEVGYAPNVAYGVNHRVFAVSHSHLHGNHLPISCRSEIVHHAKSIFPVHTHNSSEHVELQIGIFLQRLCKRMPLFFLDSHHKAVAFFEGCRRTKRADFFLYICHYI